MQTDPKARTSFFDNDELYVEFTFKRFEQSQHKIIETAPVVSSTLAKINLSQNTSLQQTTFALHGQTLIKYQKEASKAPESFLEISYSRFQELRPSGPNFIQGFSLTKNGITYEFYSSDKKEMNQWKAALKNVCVLTRFHEDYKGLKMIGKGSFAKVYLVESKASGKHFAAKSFVKENVINSSKASAKPAMLNEIDLMRSFNHDNIIKLYEVYETEKSIYLIIELIEGKPLQNIIEKSTFREKYSDKKIMKMIFSILDALSYLASKGVMHRDLKPDNILVDKEDKIKIADFGLATYIDVPEYIFGKCGTPGYLAPEVLKYNQKNSKTAYDHRCDAFSAGCILFYMLFGRRFFEGNDASEVLLLNRKFNALDSNGISLAKAELKNPNSKISKEGVKLNLQLLEFDHNRRISASKALFHPYFNPIYSSSVQSIDISAEDLLPSRMGSFMSDHILPSLREVMPSPKLQPMKSRFTARDSLYLDMGKPEYMGKIETLVVGSNNNSILISQRGRSGEGSKEGSISSFAKLSQQPDQKKKGSFKNVNAGGNAQNFRKAAIFRNMQKNNGVQEEEEGKEDTMIQDDSFHNKQKGVGVHQTPVVKTSDSSFESEIDFESEICNEDNRVELHVQKLKAEAGLMIPSIKARFGIQNASKR